MTEFEPTPSSVSADSTQQESEQTEELAQAEPAKGFDEPKAEVKKEEDGFQNGDLVWAKFPGFPWWPGKVFYN